MPVGRLVIILLVIVTTRYAVSAEKVLTACASPSWVPSTWETRNSIDGLFVGMLNDFASHSGLTIKYQKIGAWARCLRQAEKGEIDIVLGAYKTPERLAWGEYSQAIIYDFTRIFALENRLNIDRIEDLTPYRGGVRIGDSYGKEMDDFIGQQALKENTILYLNNEENIIKMIANYRLDYFPGVEGNTYSMIVNLKQQGGLDNSVSIKAIGPNFSVNSLHFVVSKKHPEAKSLISEINAFYQKNYNKKSLEALKAQYHQAYLQFIKEE